MKPSSTNHQQTNVNSNASSSPSTPQHHQQQSSSHNHHQLSNASSSIPDDSLHHQSNLIPVFLQTSINSNHQMGAAIQSTNNNNNHGVITPAMSTNNANQHILASIMMNKSVTGLVGPNGYPLYPMADDTQSKQRRIAATIIVVGFVASLAFSIAGWILLRNARESGMR